MVGVLNYFLLFCIVTTVKITTFTIALTYFKRPASVRIQTGFTFTILNALGEGIYELAVRITLWDGVPLQ